MNSLKPYAFKTPHKHPNLFIHGAAAFGNIFFFLFCIIIFLIICPDAPAYPESASINQYGVNWSLGIAEARGIGRPPDASEIKSLSGKSNRKEMTDDANILQTKKRIAFELARENAKKALYDIIKSIQIDSETTVADLSTETISKLPALLSDAEIIKEEYKKDGTVCMALRLKLFGKYLETVLPDDIKHLDSIKPVDFNHNQTNASGKKKKEYSGLVVDARGISAKPALYPRIWDEFGKQIYGAQYVDRKYAVQKGMSGFSNDLDDAVKKDRVGTNPLVVKGLRTKGNNRSDIIISNADATRIKSAVEHLLFLKQCKVVIVLGE